MYEPDKNPYYNPETMGLETIAMLEYSSGNYEFDTLVVWREIATGKLYSMRDSGCSCPVPFEEYDSIDKLDLVNYDDFYRTVMSEKCEYLTPFEVHEFIEKVRAALTKADGEAR